MVGYVDCREDLETQLWEDGGRVLIYLRDGSEVSGKVLAVETDPSGKVASVTVAEGVGDEYRPEVVTVLADEVPWLNEEV